MKRDFIQIWACQINTDIFIVSESWLNKSIPDRDVGLDGYNIFRADITGRGGGVAILCQK